MKKDEILAGILIVIIGIASILCMCFRSEQIDAKKELSNTPIENVNR